MKKIDLEYNTAQEHLLFSEHGRNVQKMVAHICTIKDREERNKAAQAVVQVMSSLNPQMRDLVDFKHKLWDHLFIISAFKLDVDSPYPKPKPEQFKSKPEIVPYPATKIRYKHYGQYVEGIINEAIKIDDPEKKNYLVELLANLMKRQYLNWNRDSVNDELIMNHLEELSKGKLKTKENFTLKHSSEFVMRNNNVNKISSMSANGEGGGKNKKRNKHRNNRNFRNNNRNK
jgi:Domain of unknown function (DUF4290)